MLGTNLIHDCVQVQIFIHYCAKMDVQKKRQNLIRDLSLNCEYFRRKKERQQGSQVASSQGQEEARSRGQGLGAKIRNSRSLQSLEVATLDGVRSMVDTAQNMGETMRSRYNLELPLNIRET